MEFDHNIPIYVQVIQEIKREVVKGILQLGDKLPSGRELAAKYQINPNTASRIYKELESEGVCFTKRGLGTYITEDPNMVKKMKEHMAEELIRAFLKGMQDLNFTKEEVVQLIEQRYND